VRVIVRADWYKIRADSTVSYRELVHAPSAASAASAAAPAAVHGRRERERGGVSAGQTTFHVLKAEPPAGPALPPPTAVDAAAATAAVARRG